MPARIKNFLPFVETAAISIVHYLVLLFQTYSAFSCYWVERSWSVYQPPFNFKLLLIILQVPYVAAQSRTQSFLFTFHVISVAIPPFLEGVPCDPSVSLNVARHSLSYCGSIYNTVCLAPTLHRAVARATPAVTARLLDLLLLVDLKDLHIVPWNCLGHVGHAFVANLHCLPGEQLTQGVIDEDSRVIYNK